MSYTNIFGGYNINTAFPSYMNYVIAGTLQLNWASSFVDTAAGTNNVTAQINDLEGAAPIAIAINNPLTTTQGSGVVIVTIASNPTLVTGNMVTIAGATTTNGITNIQLNITAAITVINDTSFSYVTAGVAGGGPFTGGGNAVTYDPLPVVSLADATLISVGQEIQFNNLGANLITITDFLGNQIVQIPPIALTNQFILYLQDNTTQGGTWGITQLGAGTSQAQSNALAGYGTISLNSQINTNFPGKLIGANYVVQLADRASILVWTGGVGTITLPNQLPGFYVAVNNEGSGVVSVNTPDGTTIDGAASFLINPSQSAYFIGVGANWNTLGYGVETFFQVNAISLNLAPINPSITLTNAQSSKLVQNYTGLLANNVTVYYPAAPGQWYINNATTGPYTVTVQLAGPTGMPFVIPQGEREIFYSDGNSIYNTPTVATSAIFPDGTVGAPGINFQAQNTTGFYRISSGLVGYASAGTQGLTLGGPVPGYGLGISGGLALRFYNATNTNFVGFRAPGVPNGTVWQLPSTDSVGVQALTSNGATALSWQNFGTVSNVSGTLNQISVTNPTTTPVISISPTYVGQTSINTLGVVTTGTWNATALTVPVGGTGRTSLTPAYGVLCAGTVATGPVQVVASTGVAGQTLTSNGAALPTWQNGVSFASFNNMVAPVLLQGRNITLNMRVSIGVYSFNFTTPFTNPNPIVVASPVGSGFVTVTPFNITANSFSVSCASTTTLTQIDPNGLTIIAVGV